jgi:hypothetical protein
MRTNTLTSSGAGVAEELKSSGFTANFLSRNDSIVQNEEDEAMLGHSGSTFAQKLVHSDRQLLISF